ncbi:MAG TPA: hypothetical protein VNQ90_10325 [Chthoniobacteraceae bacterium]|nr:hypothetical protein [Chthoniobacteraceae bacterium]
MNRQQIRLGLALQEAGVDLSVKKFDQRLVLQKAVYLLQEANIHLGYRFRWYLKGPYSPDLADDVFTVAALPDKGASEVANWELDAASKKKVSLLKALFSKHTGPSLAKHLELLASVLFLVRTGQAGPGNIRRIVEILHKNNKHFNESEVTGAFKELSSHGFAF